MGNKLEKLNQLLSLMQNDTVTPKQLEKFIFDVLEVIKKAKNSFDTMSEEGEKMYSETIDKVVSVCEEQIKSLQEIQSKTISEIDTRVAEKKLEIENLLNEIKKIKATPGKNGEPGKDGKDADEQHIIEQVLKNIPTPKELVLNGEEVVSVINELPTEEKYLIDASHIKNLPIKGNGSTGVRMLKRLVDVNVDGITNGQTLVWNSTTGMFEAGSGGGGSGWSLTGNAGTTAGTNFVGTTDNVDVVFKRNSEEFLRFEKSGTTQIFEFGGSINEFWSNQDIPFLKNQDDKLTLYGGTTPCIYLDNGLLYMQTTSWVRDGNELRFSETGNGNFVGLKAGTLSADTTWTLPTTDSTGTQALTSDGAGILRWDDFATPSDLANYIPYTGASSDIDLNSQNLSSVGQTHLTPATVTGAATDSAFHITQTYNTTGAPTMILVQLTDTASNASALFFDYQKGGVSQLKLTKSGALTATGAIVTGANIQTTGAQFLTASGSASAPGYAFGSGTNLGLYRIGADNLGLTVGGTLRTDWSTTAMTFRDGYNFAVGTSTGTKFPSASTQKWGAWGVTPIVQPTTSVTGATLVSNGGTTLTDTDTFDGYTLKQVVKALRNTGLLA